MRTSAKRLERVSNIDDLDSGAPLRPDFKAFAGIAGTYRGIFETRSRNGDLDDLGNGSGTGYSFCRFCGMGQLTGPLHRMRVEKQEPDLDDEFRER